jgi:5-methyltetrahydrofolate--homocysteine methyltransferase
VLHVLDASRAVGVVGQLKNAAEREPFIEANRREQEKLREHHRAEAAGRPLLKLEDARRRRTQVDWSAYEPPRPSFTGLRVFDAWPLEELVPFIDWSPFFHTWELKGTYPRIFENPTWGGKARELFDDARRMLDRIVAERLLTAQAVMGFFPANAEGDDIVVYTDEARGACSPPSAPCGSRRTSRPASPSRRSPISWPRARPGSRTSWAPLP